MKPHHGVRRWGSRGGSKSDATRQISGSEVRKMGRPVEGEAQVIGAARGQARIVEGDRYDEGEQIGSIWTDIPKAAQEE